MNVMSYIDDSIVGNPINNFTKYLEKKVADLLIESCLPRINES